MKLWMKNIILVLFVIIISAIPVLFLKNAEFTGADSLAGNAILEVAPNYVPWFNPIMEPKSGEIESLLFALQASIGAGIVGFVLGRITSKSKKVRENK
jgi:cobalt/nickel transport protein